MGTLDQKLKAFQEKNKDQNWVSLQHTLHWW